MEDVEELIHRIKEYELEISLLKDRYESDIKAKDERIKFLEEDIKYFKELSMALAQKTIKIEQSIQTSQSQGDKNMSGDKTINTGGGNYNESIGGDYIQVNQGDNINQSGSTFGIGVNKGTVNTQNIAGNLNQSNNEVKEMIANLRQQVETLENQVVRSEALEYVDYLEAEIIESPNPKPLKIKPYLTMLWNTGKDVALFANAVTALAVRFGVNL